ncbi:MAG: hypothetical protein EON57_13700 [Alphaproteobacteria bacterium]|nr:MAG: hypothetical protein EON57_13700 [Alphaproteobacteria bacterium]
MGRLLDEAVFALANASVWFGDPAFALLCTLRLGRIPDFARPRGHNELVQWRKNFDHNPDFAIFCDKLAARDWARRRVPELNSAEIMWVGADPAALPAELLTAGYVVKSTNGSGRNYYPGRTGWTAEQRSRRLARWLEPASRLGEWGYSQVPPRLFVERLIGGPDGIVDLTFRCHDGAISVAFVATHWKSASAQGAYLTADGQRIDRAVEGAAPLPGDVLAPGVFARAADHARRISAGLDQLRVDFIVDGENIYLGELTVYSASGFGDEERVGVGPDIERRWLGAIGLSWFLRAPQRGFRARYAEAFRRWVPKRLAELR